MANSAARWTRDEARAGPTMVRQTASCGLWGNVYEFTVLEHRGEVSWTAFKDAELIGSGLASDLEAARNAAERCAALGSTRLAELRRALGRPAR